MFDFESQGSSYTARQYGIVWASKVCIDSIIYIVVFNDNGTVLTVSF